MRVAVCSALAAVLLAAVSVAAAAGDGGFECKPGGVQQEMNACAVRDSRAADARLNSRYAAVMQSLPVDRRAALRVEQREWLRRRDPGCKAEAASSEGGSIWPHEFYGCLEASTRARTAELEDWKVRR